jgi:diguanylate cyclase (GGDEF)-like protein
VVQEERRALRVLLQLTDFLSGGRPLQDRLQAITDAAVALLPCDHASIRLFDPSRTTLLARARSGKGAGTRSLVLTRGQGIAGWVVEHRLAACVPDTRADPRFVVAVGQGFSVRSMVAEPLLAATGPLGVLGASSPEPNAFGEDDVVLARILASCSVGAIERARLERLSTVDDLTLAYTTQCLAQRLEEEMDRARHSGSTLSILDMDLDRLEHVNRSYGRDIADRVLGIFSERVRGATRRYDILVRSGDDEFVLLMPGTSPIQAAASAEKLRMAIGDEPMEPRQGGYISQRVSVGVATWDGRESMDSVMRRVGAALRESKAKGGDTVSKAAPNT